MFGSSVLEDFGGKSFGELSQYFTIYPRF